MFFAISTILQIHIGVQVGYRSFIDDLGLKALHKMTNSIPYIRKYIWIIHGELGELEIIVPHAYRALFRMRKLHGTLFPHLNGQEGINGCLGEFLH